MTRFGFGPRFTHWARDPRSKLAITGASGWLGKALTAEAIAAGFRQEDGRLRLFASSSRTIDLAGTSLTLEPLGGTADLGAGDWLLAHLAFLGKERTEDLAEATFRAANNAILSAALRLAGTAESARIVFASSGAAKIAEKEHTSSPGQIYGRLKLEQEAQITEWCRTRSIVLAVPRIFNIGGPFINKRDRYALSSIVQNLLDGQAVRLNAKHPVFRSYVHVRELVAVMGDACFDDAAGAEHTFDTAGREIVEIADLAQTAARVLGVAADIERAWLPMETADWYVGDARDYMLRVAGMGRPAVSLDQIIADTADWCARGTGGRNAP